ncbi:Oidioi.mRNA.OKI2018_I69.chr2.g4754.t1.cds [Oikopleura dioica]|uniref:Oidioi.mRNA.OKI2018_I69.chr2.g4754.t1.cds n=1 Tax=Oikopleura dioica TaxID=34765 RepID=A0ABN7SZX5_OIKDI|nr:Oidioi.mRNA.OKI2018_I69.chr2.g4754.t1.cds [Oikopleura dioica]
MSLETKWSVPEKPTFDILAFGHSNSCKSTIGHLIYECGGIDGRAFERVKNREKAAEKKGSVDYAKLLDKLIVEKGNTMSGNKDIWKFQTNTYDLNIIDASDEHDNIEKMILGASKIQCALLILSAKTEEYEASFSKDGRIREHFRLVSYLLNGIDFIVCVDDMESSSNSLYSEKKFNEITAEICKYFEQIDIDPEAVPFIPISSLHGDNIVEPSANMTWFKGWNKKVEEGTFSGKTLIEALDRIIHPKRVAPLTTIKSLPKPLRLPVYNVLYHNGQYLILGRVETGVIRVGMDVSFCPLKLKGEVKSIHLINWGSWPESMSSRQVSEASIGDTVGFTLKDTLVRVSMKPSEGFVSIKEIQRGSVVSDSNYPAKEAKIFKAEVLITNHPTRITRGFSPRLQCFNQYITCEFTKLIAKKDKRSDKSLENYPEMLRSGDFALVEITPTEPVCVEPFKDYPGLGRFAITDIVMKQTVGVGVIMEVEKYEEKETDNDYKSEKIKNEK